MTGPIASTDKDQALRLSIALLALPLVLQASVVAGFALQASLGVGTLLVALTAYLVVCWQLFAPQRDLKGVAITVLIVAASFAVALFFQDFDYDSRAYHLPASVMMLEGWNPLYQTVPPENPDARFPGLQIVTFAKGQWYINAAAMLTFQSIEAGKFTHGLYLAASFLTGFVVLRRKLDGRTALPMLLAAGIALNPVALAQMPINYLDGAVASLLTLLLLCFYGLVDGPSKSLTLIAVLSTILLASAKTSGLAFAAVCWAVFGLYVLLFRREEALSWIKPVSVMGLAIVLLNVNPYVTNAMDKGNPVYPLLEKQSFLKRPYFEGFNRFERFAVSYSSATSFMPEQSESALDHWRNPLSPRNVMRAMYPQNLARTLGALGSWFGIGLLLSLFLIFRIGRPEAVILVMIFLTTFSHDEGWHSRYCPQVWIVPWIIAAGVLRKTQREWTLPVLLTLSITSASCAALLFTYPNQIVVSKQYFEVREAYLEGETTFEEGFEPYHSTFNSRPEVFRWVELKRLELSGNLATRLLNEDQNGAKEAE